VRTGVWPGSESIPFFEKYAKGTMHQGDADQAHVDFIKSYINELIDQLEKDYRSGALSSIQGFATHTYGLPMERIEEVITCTLAHDSLHLGYALAQRRALSI